MPVEQIPLGVLTPMVQNIAYALPNVACFITSTAAVEGAPTSTGAWTALTGANTTGVNASLPFVRCPGGAANIFCRRVGN